jgi:N-formylglutamate amidohydrolase
VRNAPYAGAHILARHGRPDRACHAVQLEFDRRLYLDAGLSEPSAGLATARMLLARLAKAALAAAEALHGGDPIRLAAE